MAPTQGSCSSPFCVAATFQVSRHLFFQDVQFRCCFFSLSGVTELLPSFHFHSVLIALPSADRRFFDLVLCNSVWVTEFFILFFQPPWLTSIRRLMAIRRLFGGR